MKSFRRSACRLAIILAVLGGCLRTAQAGAEQWAGEDELKAALVYNIVPFVDWPKGALGDRVIIGFAGNDSMASTMGRFFAGKRIGSRPIDVHIVHSRSELRACNVLLIAYPDSSRMREALGQLRDTNVLTIGDGEQFTKLGGVISFVPHDNTFRLAINSQASERAHLKISAKLMSMAKLVPDDPAARKE